MTEQHDRRLIEDSLPLEAISFQSAREKSIRHGHISTLHIWWARRPLAAMRAAIFAALMPAPENEEEREQMHRLIGGTYNAKTEKWEGGICDWDSVKDGNSEVIQQAQALIRKHYPDAPPKVLDPFMGGGSTGLEALRLGAEAHGVELNPVAHIIELCTLVYPQKYGQKITRVEYEARPGTLPPVEHMAAYVDDEYDANDDSDPEQQSFDFDIDEMVNPLAEDVKRWGHWVRQRAYEEIGTLYKTTENRHVAAYLWARTITCHNPQCKAKMPLLRQYWLARTKSKRLSLKPIVDTQNKTIEFTVVENNEIDFDPTNGTMKSGSVTCLVCNTSADGSYIREEAVAERMGQMLIGVVEVSEDETGKFYRSPTEQDLDNYHTATQQLEAFIDQNPDSVMVGQISDIRPSSNARGISGLTRYGILNFNELYNNRQMLVLQKFGEIISEAAQKIEEIYADQEYAKAVATYLSLALDKVADYNSRVSTWDSTRESMRNTFPRQAIQMVWDYAESNPFSGSSGDWSNAFNWIERTIIHTSLASDNPAKLINGDATRLPYNDEYRLNAVITDPPYYDSVPYADLADFFYTVLRSSLTELYPDQFVTPLTPKSSEIIEHARRGDEAQNFYEKQMTKAFSEANRVLDTHGVMAVVFAHTSTTAWETLLNSLLSAGLVVTASWPLHTEMSTRLRARGNASLASSIFIVCRKRVAETDGIYDDVRPLMKARIKERLDYFWKQGIRGADFFISAIGPAVEVFGQYKTVRKLSGDVVTVAELLDIVQQEVADYALSQVMNGGAAFGPFDAPTRFYIMYRWSYGKNKIEFDDGMRLAMALGAEVDLLMHVSSVLKKSGSSVNLLSPYEREDNEKLGEPARDRMSAPLIDMVHRAALLWRAGKRDELTRFVSINVGTRVEALRAVAQALINVLPDGDKEKQLYEGFLQGELPTAPTSNKMFSDEDFS